MDLKGQITATELAEIFQMLTQTRKEGTLTVANHGRKKAIYFSKQGVTLLFDSEKKTGSLGQMLLDHGKISDRQLGQALATQKQSGHRLGEILAGMGIVAQEEIEDLVRRQIEEEIFDLLSWRGGTFEFSEGQRKLATVLKDRPLTNLVIDPNSVLMEAARRLDEWQVIESDISSINEVPIGVKGPSEEPPEEDLLEVVLKAVDGRSTADEIMKKTRLSKFEVHSSLHELLKGGWLRLANARELVRLAAGCRRRGENEKCLELYELAVHRQPEDHELRSNCAKLCEELGGQERALTHYRWLARNHIDADHIDHAVPILRHIKELKPDDLFAREGLFQSALRLNQLEPAAQEGQFLIDAYRKSRELDKAKLVAERLLGFNPQSPTRLRTLVDILLEMGQATEAIRHCEQLAVIFNRQGNAEELERIYEQILVLDPRRHDIRERLRQIGRSTAKKRKKIIVVLSSLGALAVITGVVSLVLLKQSRVARAYRDAESRTEPLVAKGSFAEAIGLYEQFIREHEGSSWAEKAQHKVEDLKGQQEKQRAELEARIAGLTKEAGDFEQKQRHQDALNRYRELLALVAADRKPTIEKKIQALEQVLKEIDTGYAQAQTLEEGGDYLGARRAYMQLVQEHPEVLSYIDVKLPVQVVSLPAGAELSIDGEKLGATTPGVIRYQPYKKLKLRVSKPGCKQQLIELKDEPDWSPPVIVLPRLPAWEFATEGAIEASPVVQGNLVIIGSRGSRDGIVYALEVSSAEVKWRLPAPRFQAFTATPAVVKDRVYITTNTEGSLIALSLDSGEELWEYETGQLMRCSPCVTPGGLVCVGSFDKHLYALAEVEGGQAEPRWKFPTEGSIQSSPCYFDGKLYFGSDDAKVYCVSAEEGEKVWESPTSAAVRSSPRVQGGVVYVGSDDGCLYALDAQSGSELWKFRTEGKVVASPYFYQGQVLLGSADGRLYRLDPARQGEEVWRYDTGKPIVSSPCCKEGMVYFGSNDGNLYALEFATGKLVWQGSTGGPINCSPVVGDGFVIVGSDDKKAYAFPIEA